MRLDEMRWDEIRWYQIRSDDMIWSHLIASDEMRWDEMISDDMISDEMRWTRWDEINLDEMRTVETRCFWYIFCWTRSFCVVIGSPHMKMQPTWEIYVDFLCFRNNNVPFNIFNFSFKNIASYSSLFVECLIVHLRGYQIRKIGSEESPSYS